MFKMVTISLSEAVLWVGSGTPHRSLRSLCVVLTINQRLRRCAAVFCGCAAVNGHHLGGDAVIRQRCRGYWHHLAVMRLFAAIISREGIQPERLNAEGDSPSALSRGLSEAQPPDTSRKKKKRRT